MSMPARKHQEWGDFYWVNIMTVHFDMQWQCNLNDNRHKRGPIN
jgi:hypothetical protein